MVHAASAVISNKTAAATSKSPAKKFTGPVLRRGGATLEMVRKSR